MEPIRLIPFLSILLVSFLGSGHCGSMCGGFAILSTQSHRFSKGISLFHAGRLITYLSLGFILGTFGGFLNDALVFKTSEIVCAMILLTLAWRALFPKIRLKPLSIGFKLVERSKKWPLIFPFVLGVVTGFLPCGWLYGFLALAIGSGNTTEASLVMLLFWFGTLPVLTLVGIAPKALGARLSRFNRPRLKAALLVIAAFSTIASHALVAPTFTEANQSTSRAVHFFCHGKTIAK